MIFYTETTLIVPDYPSPASSNKPWGVSSSWMKSCSLMALRMLFLELSWISPASRNSSSIKYACRDMIFDWGRWSLEDHSNLLIVIDNVQFTNTAEVLVQELHEVVNDLQGEQLVVSFICSKQSLGDNVRHWQRHWPIPQQKYRLA